MRSQLEQVIHAIRLETETESADSFTLDQMFQSDPAAGGRMIAHAVDRERQIRFRGEGRSRESAAQDLLNKIRQWKMDSGIPFRTGLPGLDGTSH